TLNASSSVNVSLGGPSPTPLFDATGNLTLAGILNISSLGGVGVYRLMQYGGALTDNGPALGALPSRVSPSELFVQTAIPRQVNLVNTAGQTLNFWDGGNPANQNNGVVDGGNGIWNRTNFNWTNANGTINSPMTPAPGFGIFAAAPGVVTVDDSGGSVAI